MKKFIPKLILILFLTNIIQPIAFAQEKNENYKAIIDFFKPNQLKAKKILKNYILNEYKKDPELIKLANIKTYPVLAVEFDLNNDGINEIIGTHQSTFFSCSQGSLLYILQKDKNNNYTNIIKSAIYFEPINKTYILKNKNNNYNEIKMYFKSNHIHDYESFILTYDGLFYSQKK